MSAIQAQSQSQLRTVLPWPKMIDAWLTYQAEDRQAAKNTVHAYRVNIGYFKDWLDGEGLAFTHITSIDLKAYRAATRAAYSIQTTNLRLAAVRRFYAWCKLETFSGYDPAAGVENVKRKRSRNHKRDALTPAEVAAVLAAPDPDTEIGRRDLAMLTVMAYCAVRGIGLRRMKIKDVRTRGSRMTIDLISKGETEKGGEYAIIPTDQEHVIRDLLADRAEQGAAPDDPLFCSLSRRSYGGPLCASALRRIAKGYFRRCGILEPAKTTHSLRVSAITSAINAGAEPIHVQEMAGHASIETTLGYYRENERITNPVEDMIVYP